jgi:hypothetical protein
MQNDRDLVDVILLHVEFSIVAKIVWKITSFKLKQFCIVISYVTLQTGGYVLKEAAHSASLKREVR